MPTERTERRLVLHSIRRLQIEDFDRAATEASPEAVNLFLAALPPEEQASVLLELVEEWGNLGAAPLF